MAPIAESRAAALSISTTAEWLSVMAPGATAQGAGTAAEADADQQTKRQKSAERNPDLGPRVAHLVF